MRNQYVMHETYMQKLEIEALIERVEKLEKKLALSNYHLKLLRNFMRNYPNNMQLGEMVREAFTDINIEE